MLELLKKKQKIIGLKQTVRAVEQNIAEKVYIAQDADERIVIQLKEMCRDKGVEVLSAESMKVLGRACGIDVGAAVVALVRE